MPKIPDSLKRRVRLRQGDLCAACGFPLREFCAADSDDDFVADGFAINFHHVAPHPGSGDNSADNLVAICRGVTKDTDAFSCHYHVHQGGRYARKEVAPPEHFEFSHGRGNASAHQEWVEKMRRRYPGFAPRRSH